MIIKRTHVFKYHENNCVVLFLSKLLTLLCLNDKLFRFIVPRSVSNMKNINIDLHSSGVAFPDYSRASLHIKILNRPISAIMSNLTPNITKSVAGDGYVYYATNPRSHCKARLETQPHFLETTEIGVTMKIEHDLQCECHGGPSTATSSDSELLQEMFLSLPRNDECAMEEAVVSFLDCALGI